MLQRPNQFTFRWLISTFAICFVFLVLLMGCTKETSDDTWDTQKQQSRELGYESGFNEGKKTCEEEHELPLVAKPMTDWTAGDFAEAGMDTSDAALKPWNEAAITEATMKSRMMAEQGAATTFFSPAGKPYADELNANIQKLKDQNPSWFQDYLYAKAPLWMRLRASEYRINDPETGALWEETYKILAKTTDDMGATDSAAAQEQIFTAAVQQIEELMIKNEKFKSQIVELQGEIFKQPTASQLRVFHADKTYSEPIFPIQASQ